MKRACVHGVIFYLSLLFSCSQISKAMMLHKGAEYIVSTKQERVALSERAEKLRCEIESLSSEIRYIFILKNGFFKFF